MLQKIHFAVEGRNGYWAIDEYKNPEGDKHSGCVRHVESFSNKNKANSVCGYLNGIAYQLNEANYLLNQSELGMPQGWTLVADVKQFLMRYK